jgi:hypothetical protein
LSQRLVRLEYRPSIYFEGLDAQNGLTMFSDITSLDLMQGADVCPAGYVLVLDHPNATTSPAVCTLCRPGTYSINPLAFAPDAKIATPACLSCPAGGDCTKGGADVTFAVGGWRDDGTLYVLESCPPGYQLVNSSSGTSSGTFSNILQQCKACRPGQYIMNPNRDNCENCPPGPKRLK